MLKPEEGRNASHYLVIFVFSGWQDSGSLSNMAILHFKLKHILYDLFNTPDWTEKSNMAIEILLNINYMLASLHILTLALNNYF